MKTTILKGVHVGNNVIIGANSLVNKDIPNNCVVAGNPARVIMPLDKYYEKRKAAQYQEAEELVRLYREHYGKEADESQWDKIFEIREDGSFYMGDYVLEEVMDCQEQKAVNRADQEFIGEPSAGYGKRKRLKEIRFDLVYYR